MTMGGYRKSSNAQQVCYSNHYTFAVFIRNITASFNLFLVFPLFTFQVLPIYHHCYLFQLAKLNLQQTGEVTAVQSGQSWTNTEKKPQVLFGQEASIVSNSNIE